ncbi:sodium:alanine symporter family protein [Aerococcaceae bacterium zg-BR9]|uniref:alanine/glycine:cation symporter family protein n=1 Tax=Aerococcaceae bacterium zg-1292 TaxID=2774330 RepID=UPI0040636C01|nr:sodium:alanine symporter family protein [Aerococcaceae bacterium zg-BR9]MBF6978257.1 sodium:alanine symporter family protein [Aerococcaceae bacterium zg-BR22]
MEFIKQISDWLWGPPLLILIVGGGLYISIITGFFQLRYFGFILKETLGKMFAKTEGGEGTVSAFQAMTTALASSIGAANIVVVPTIIFTAGPGAVFWMWVVAILAEATKFAEVALSVKYRERNSAGDFVGGASYTFKNAFQGKFGKAMGALISFFFMIEILPSITLQTLSAAGPMVNVGKIMGFDPDITKKVAIIIIFVLTGLVVYGGVKAIGRVTEKLVPFMALIYITMGLIIIILNIQHVPAAFGKIILGAFNPTAVAGGAVGATLKNVIQKGVARGVYSNEAGMGSAGYGHAAATTDHPARQGLWGCFEVIADTLVVCTISALIVLVTDTWTPGMDKAAIDAVSPVAVERAINTAFGTFGSILISLCLFMFVLSTIIVIVFYCEKQAEYLFGYKGGLLFRAIATFMIIAAIFLSFGNAGVFLDVTLALVVIPNMIGVLMLSKEVKMMKEDFFNNPLYYPGNKKIK